MLLFEIAASVLLVSVMILAKLAYDEHRSNRARSQQAMKAISEAGMALVGDPLGIFEVAADLRGVAVSVKSNVQWRLPGSSGEQRTVGLITAPLRDLTLLVCLREDVDLIMGPLPAASRVAIRDSTFEAQYVAFTTARAEATTSLDYRCAPEERSRAWAQQPILRAMQTLGLVWMRADEDSCEIAIRPIRWENAHGAALLIVNIGRALNGLHPLPFPPVQQGEAPRYYLVHTRLKLACAASLGGVFVGPVLGQFELLRSLTSDIVCGPGAALLGVRTLHCSNQVEPRKLVHYTVMMTLYAAIAFLVTAIVTMVHVSKRERRREMMRSQGLTT